MKKTGDVGKRELASIQALCRLGLPAQAFVAALLDALHAFIPSRRNLFDWADAEGRLVEYLVEGPVDVAVSRHYFDEYHNLAESKCMPAFASLRDMPVGVRGADDVDSRAFRASALYREIWVPQGLHTRIEGVVRARGGRLLGSLVLYRGEADAPFTPRDERALAQVLPWVAQGLERAKATQGGRERCEPGPAAPASIPDHVPRRDGCESLLLGLDGTPRHASAGAHGMLLLAGGRLDPQALQPPLSALIARQLGGLLASLREQRRLGPAALRAQRPSQTCLNGFGRFDMSASLLWASGPVAAAGASGGTTAAPSEALAQVTLRWMEPRRAAMARALRALPLTAGQAAVCQALDAAGTQADVARRLGIAPSTVVDHVRKIHRALDVGCAAELRAFLDARIAAAAEA